MTGCRDRQNDGLEKICYHSNKWARMNTIHVPVKQKKVKTKRKALSMKKMSKKRTK